MGWIRGEREGRTDRGRWRVDWAGMLRRMRGLRRRWREESARRRLWEGEGRRGSCTSRRQTVLRRRRCFERHSPRPIFRRRPAHRRYSLRLPFSSLIRTPHPLLKSPQRPLPRRLRPLALVRRDEAPLTRSFVCRELRFVALLLALAAGHAPVSRAGLLLWCAFDGRGGYGSQIRHERGKGGGKGDVGESRARNGEKALDSGRSCSDVGMLMVVY